VTAMAHDLLASVLDAHGGLDTWRGFTRVEATIVSGGLMFEMKGQPQDPTPRRMSVALQREWGSVHPFGGDDQRTDFTPTRVAIEKLDGAVVAELTNPETSFAGDDLHTPWNPLQRAYFNGYALWTYLTSPFLLTLPGFAVRELDPIEDDGRTLTGLQFTIPDGFVSHSTQQEFYFGPDLLLVRHDYRVDIAGSFSAIQYISDFLEADGIQMPTKRRAYRCGEDGRPLFDQLMVSIDLSDYRFS
jgi:hypothetical protein